MNYAKIKPLDTANAPNICCTIFFSGCTHGCRGCFNKDVQNFQYGKEFTKETMDYFIKKASYSQVKNICILGGEPFQQDYDTLKDFLNRLNVEVKKPIWVWTGYLYQEIMKDKDKSKLLQYIDILIDGMFIEELKDINLKYRGSSNQNVIDVKESLKQNKIINYVK